MNSAAPISRLAALLFALVAIQAAIQAPNAAHGQQTINYDQYVLRVGKAAGQIIIDGAPNEDAWKQAVPVSNFVQHYPQDSIPARSSVEVRAAFDEKYLYFAFVCHDSASGNFFLRSLRRDFDPGENDGIAVFIDPTGTKTNGFGFGITPMGVQREGMIAFGGMFGLDQSWDNIWISETAREKDRWTAEVAIPFRSIRFEGNRKQWRINFARWNWKINELSTWTQFPLNFRAASLAHTGILEWETPPESPGVNLSIIPSVVGTLNHKYNEDNKSVLGYNIGGDVKYAVTSALNLDLTVLPDFSNVNVDRQVTNLERFSLFFPEQRQFFIENSDLFSSFGFSQIRPFFSRKIGITKNKDGNNTSIAIPFGARLSGNVTQDLRVGLMSIQTAHNTELGAETQNYTVAAAQYRVLERSNIGAIFVNRQGKNFSGTAGNDFNRTLGADFTYASGDGKWQGKLFYHHNFTPDSKPDKYATAGWLGYSTPSLEVNWNHELIGAGYNPEVGFVPRNGVFRLQPFFNANMFPQDRSIVNQHGFGGEMNAYWSIQPFQYDPQTRFKLLDRSVFSWYYVTFANTAEISGFVGNIYTYLYESFDPTGRGEDDNKLPITGYEYWRTGMDFNTDRRQALSFRGFVYGGQYYNGNSVRYGGNVNWRVQPFGSISIDVQRDEIRLPEPFKSAAFTLIGAQLDFTPTRDVFFTTFLQYNAQINNVNVNSRIQWRFAPMSDLFIVYTDNYDSQFWKIKNRGLALKLTYWLNV